MKVSEIKTLSFTALKLSDQINIKNNGRPVPKLNIVQVQPACKNRAAYIRKFDQSLYDKILWLCGCEEKNAFFCFVCLLFGGDDKWTKEGIRDLKHIAEKVTNHEKSAKHMNSLVSFQFLGKTNIATRLSTPDAENIRRHNETVLKNRHVLEKVINILKLCGKCNLEIRGHNETNVSLNKGAFLELVDYTENFDSRLYIHFQDASAFKGTSMTIQNELLDCMLQICRNYILSEIKQSSFVALIMADDTTDAFTQTRMVLVLRYFLNGKIHERFWGFANPEGQNAENLSKCILEQINPILQDSPEKLIAQTYEGAAVIGQIGGVNVKIEKVYKNAHFIYCYSHQFNRFLEQATADIPSVRIFFVYINAISAFFSNSPDRTSALNQVCERPSQTRWNFQSRAVQTVFQYKDNLLECFNNIQSGKPKGFNTETELQAAGFIKWLNDDTFQFWLDFFNKLIPHVDTLFNQLQKITDAVKIQHAIDNFQKMFKTITDNLPSLTEVGKWEKRRKLNMENLAAKEVCNTIHVKINERFAFKNHLSGAKLFQRQNYALYKKNLPLEDITNFCNAFPMVNKQALIMELTIFYSRPEIAEITGYLQTRNLLVSYGLDSTFNEISKVLNILLTMPMTTAEAERCLPTLQLIKTYLKTTMVEERLTALTMLAIEKAVVNSIPDFNEQVIEKFISSDKHRRMEFHLKKESIRSSANLPSHRKMSGATIIKEERC